MSNADQIVMDIETAIQALETSLPTILGIVGVFYPGVKAVVPFLPFLQVALNTVQQVEQVMQHPNTPAAVKAVTDHLQSVPAHVEVPGTSQGPNTN